jgi:hypothetical protein
VLRAEGSGGRIAPTLAAPGNSNATASRASPRGAGPSHGQLTAAGLVPGDSASDQMMRRAAIRNDATAKGWNDHGRHDDGRQQGGDGCSGAPSGSEPSPLDRDAGRGAGGAVSRRSVRERELRAPLLGLRNGRLRPRRPRDRRELGRPDRGDEVDPVERLGRRGSRDLADRQIDDAGIKRYLRTLARTLPQAPREQARSVIVLRRRTRFLPSFKATRS